MHGRIEQRRALRPAGAAPGRATPFSASRPSGPALLPRDAHGRRAAVRHPGVAKAGRLAQCSVQSPSPQAAATYRVPGVWLFAACWSESRRGGLVSGADSSSRLGKNTLTATSLRRCLRSFVGILDRCLDSPTPTASSRRASSCRFGLLLRPGEDWPNIPCAAGQQGPTGSDALTMVSTASAATAASAASAMSSLLYGGPAPPRPAPPGSVLLLRRGGVSSGLSASLRRLRATTAYLPRGPSIFRPCTVSYEGSRKESPLTPARRCC